MTETDLPLHETDYPSVCYRCGKSLPHLPNGEPDYDIAATPSIPQHDDELIICRACHLAGPRHPRDFEVGDRVLIAGDDQDYIIRDRDDVAWGGSGCVAIGPAEAPWSAQVHRDQIARILGRAQ